jgi:hypothetical protein
MKTEPGHDLRSAVGAWSAKPPEGFLCAVCGDAATDSESRAQ